MSISQESVYWKPRPPHATFLHMRGDQFHSLRFFLVVMMIRMWIVQPVLSYTVLQGRVYHRFRTKNKTWKSQREAFDKNHRRLVMKVHSQRVPRSVSRLPAINPCSRLIGGGRLEQRGRDLPWRNPLPPPCCWWWCIPDICHLFYTSKIFGE